MELTFEHLPTMEDVQRHIAQCEGQHPQQAIYSTFHGGLTQVCYGCRKIRSTINLAVDAEDEAPEEEVRSYRDLAPLMAVAAERGYQVRKWGGLPHDRDHSYSDWSLLLDKEFGDAAEWLKQLQWPKEGDPPYHEKIARLRAELVQLAAVAVALIEVLDAYR